MTGAGPGTVRLVISLIGARASVSPGRVLAQAERPGMTTPMPVCDGMTALDS